MRLRFSQQKGVPVLIDYLHRMRFVLLAGLICMIMSGTVFFLYRLPVESVLYAFLLCLPFLVLIMGYDFFKYRRKHLLLHHRMPKDFDPFPHADHLIERDYQNLIHQLLNDRRITETQADRMRGDMMDYYALWAHQIKTPIAAMRLLLKDDTTHDLALSSELFKIEQYVEMALHFLHLESGLNDFVFKSCQLDDIIRGTLRKFARSFILKKIELDFSETHLTVITDEKWLAFILEQLLSNALKYTKSGKIRIYASGQALFVEDTGIGIEPEDLPRIFEKGFTGYNGRENMKSTGLGLYLCKKILDALGHQINVSSLPGIGTTFSVDLSRTEIHVD